MVSQWHILKSNATLIPPTPEEPYHKISVTNPKTGCTICIAALKPFPDPLLIDLRPDPTDWISITHASPHCGCVGYAFEEGLLFKTWRGLHLKLRHQEKDLASYAFYPEFEYARGEELAHASLIASLAVGRRVPEYYDCLIEQYGTLRQIRLLQNRRRELGIDYGGEEEAEEEPESESEEVEEEDEPEEGEVTHEEVN
ncbi:hypothetical protein F5Y14DRAFT_465093 [Nemania sp. NC0429]|nr:hypothetical protein F5Y14DRAFT_465093 [Nemania sp. NC0429]